MKATDLRPGLGVKIDGKLSVLTGVDHRTEVLSGKTLEKRLSSSDDVEDVDLDRRPMEYLYSDSSGATFMDKENYDQITMPADVLGDALLFMRPNSEAIVLLHDSNPITIELPAAVELVIKDTPPEVKGATVTNQTKEALCDTGLKIRVPAFIKVGETVKVSTADGSYLSRA